MRAAAAPVRRSTHRPFRPKQLHGTKRTSAQWDQVYHKAANVALNNSGYDITGIDARQLMAVQDTISRGLMNGWKESSIAAALKPILGKGPWSNAGYRAKLVAEYETRTAIGKAQREFWRERQAEGKLSPKAMRVFRLGPTCEHCPVCLALKGTKSPIGDDTNAPPIHPNCCCYEVVSEFGTVKKMWMPIEKAFAQAPNTHLDEEYKDLHLVKSAVPRSTSQKGHTVVMPLTPQYKNPITPPPADRPVKKELDDSFRFPELVGKSIGAPGRSTVAYPKSFVMNRPDGAWASVNQTSGGDWAYRATHPSGQKHEGMMPSHIRAESAARKHVKNHWAKWDAEHK
jgi:hypothetical protein